MRTGRLGLAVLLLAAAGCSYDDKPNDGMDPVSGGGMSGTTPMGGQPSGPASTPAANAGGPGTSGPSTGPSTVAPSGSGVDLSGSMECTDVTPCGGDVVGTWHVASSCLDLSGDLDVFLTSLACASVPATGTLQTTGTITFRPNGTYDDQTTTTGNVSFPLDSSCLAISGVPVACDRAGDIFKALGWTTTACTEGNGQCDCSLSTEQRGGLGMVLPYTEPMGAYTTADDTLTASNAKYTYCASGDTLRLTPTMAALSGEVTLQRDGSVSPSASGGAGGTMSGGEGGMMSGGGMTSGGEGGMVSGGAGGMVSGGAGGAAGGAPPVGGQGGAPSTVGQRPCDIYEAEGLPCVAAHSTVRALFGAYDGNLYQVRRADGMMMDIPVGPNGFADSSVQDSFCQGSSCTIWRVYDQSGNGNFLEAQTPDSDVGGFQNQTAANAAAESLTVGGNRVYSLFTRPSQAYWRDGSSSGMPLGADPQGVYMVTSGEHFNGGCCYNYGNAQTSRTYEGGPTMDSVYFGNCTIWGTGQGDGPWVMADMEDGIVSGNSTGQNQNLESLPFPYVTALEKNNGTSEFAIKGADATSPDLKTFYQGALPAGKNPMRKEGAIVLGSGGDCCYSNNNASEGTFYEGAIVAGYPSDAVDEEIHANIVEAGYGQ